MGDVVPFTGNHVPPGTIALAPELGMVEGRAFGILHGPDADTVRLVFLSPDRTKAEDVCSLGGVSTPWDLTNATIIMAATVRGMAEFAGLGCILINPAQSPA